MSSDCGYDLVVRQQPKQARMCSSDKVDRRPIDPPPIIQLRGVSSPGSPADDAQSFLENPYYFMFASLASPDTGDAVQYLKDGKTPVMTGPAVSNLWHLKDPENEDQDAGFFVFPELSVRSEGSYRLKLTLFEVHGATVRHCKSIFSDPFCVYIPTKFPGMQVSTDLSCSLAEQGIKIRLRHDTRVGNKPAKRAAEQEDGGTSGKRGRKSTRGGGGGRKSKRAKVDNPNNDDNAHASASAPPHSEWGVIDPSLTAIADPSLAHAPPGYTNYIPSHPHAYSPAAPGAYEAHYPPPSANPGQSSVPYTYSHYPPHPPPSNWHTPPTLHHGHDYPPPPDWYGYAQPPQQQVEPYEGEIQGDDKTGGGAKEAAAPRRVLRARPRARAGTIGSSPQG